MTIIDQHQPQPVELIPAESVRGLRRLWKCETSSCRTRLFVPGPLCPRCRRLGEPVKARPLSGAQSDRSMG